MFITNAYADGNTIQIEETTSLPVAPEPVQSGWMSMVPMVLIFVVFYFLLIRPQEKRRRQQQELVGGVKKGEEVVTSSGICGVVSKVNDDNTVEVEIAKDVSIKVLKTAIADITSRTAIEKEKKEVKKIKGK